MKYRKVTFKAEACGLASFGRLMLPWVSIATSLLFLFSAVAWSDGRSSLLPTRATFSLDLSPKPKLGGVSTATLTVTPNEAIPHLRLVVRGLGIEVLNGKQVAKHSWREEILKDGSLKAGIQKKYQFAVRFSVAPDPGMPALLQIQPWELSGPSGWVERSISWEGGWVVLDEETGEMGSQTDLMHRGFTTPLKDSLTWELSNVFQGKLEGLVASFINDESALTRTQALFLVEKSYRLVLQSMAEKNSPYCNPNKTETVDVPVGRAAGALRRDVANQARFSGKSKIQVYRDLIEQWKVERSRPKALIKKSEIKGLPPSPLLATSLIGTWKFKKHSVDSASGISTTPVDKPMRRVFVDFWERLESGANQYLARNKTDNDGVYSVSASLDPGIYYHCVFPVVLCDGPSTTYPDGYRIIVKTAFRNQWPPEYTSEFLKVWKYHLTGVIIPYNQPTVDFGTHYFWEDSLYPTTYQPSGGAANIYDDLLKGYEFVRDTMQEPLLASVRAFWEPRVRFIPGVSSYRSDTIFVTGNPDTLEHNTDEWDDDILLHEYGHHVMDNLAEWPPSNTPDHQWQNAYPNDKNLAYGEAWPYLFAGEVNHRDHSSDTYNRLGSGGGVNNCKWFSLEDPWLSNYFQSNQFHPSPWCEGVVTGTLWDMYDAVNEQYSGGGEDSLGIGQYPEILGYMWQDFKNYTVTRAESDSPNVAHKNYWIFDFISGWAHSSGWSMDNQEFGHEVAIRTIADHHGISWIPPDPPTGLTGNASGLVWNRSTEGDRWGYNIYNKDWGWPTLGYSRDNDYVNLDPDTTYLPKYHMWPQQ